jgi:hypothetical protein
MASRKRPAHYQLNRTERLLWVADHRGVLRRIAGRLGVSRQVVGQVFRRERASERISRHIDTALRRTRRL